MICRRKNLTYRYTKNDCSSHFYRASGKYFQCLQHLGQERRERLESGEKLSWSIPTGLGVRQIKTISGYIYEVSGRNLCMLN